MITLKFHLMTNRTTSLTFTDLPSQKNLPFLLEITFHYLPGIYFVVPKENNLRIGEGGRLGFETSAIWHDIEKVAYNVKYKDPIWHPEKACLYAQSLSELWWMNFHGCDCSVFFKYPQNPNIIFLSILRSRRQSTRLLMDPKDVIGFLRNIQKRLWQKYVTITYERPLLCKNRSFLKPVKYTMETKDWTHKLMLEHPRQRKTSSQRGAE